MSEDRVSFTAVAAKEAGFVFKVAANNREVLGHQPLIDSFDLQNLSGVKPMKRGLILPGIAPDSLVFPHRLLMASVIGADYRAKRLDSLVSVKHPFVRGDELKGKVEIVMNLQDAVKVVKICAEWLEIPRAFLGKALAGFILGNPRVFVGGYNTSRISVAPDIAVGLLG